jgi:hypothetical protein
MEKMKANTLRSVILCSAVLVAGLPARLLAQNPSAAESRSSQSDVATLKAQVAEQQKQIDQLRSALEEQKKLIERATGTAAQDFALPRGKALGEVASASPIIPPAAPVAKPILSAAQPAGDQSSPLQLKIGDAYIIPIGFMDFTSVYRSHDSGGGIGTNFGSIPYGNVYQNHLIEDRLSIQNSRIGFRVDALVKGAHVIGYMESDFLGNNPANVAVSSNSNTLRSRLYWVDVQKDKWEVLGGQTWSLITPGRSGISPLPGNLFFSQDIDVNYQAGLVWGRIPELRFVYHPSTKAAFALALDNAEQYVGGSAGGGAVVFPSTLTATYAGAEFNNGTTTVNAPNVFPDVIAKLALDPSSKFHFEIGGVERQFRAWNPANLNHYSTTGGGGFLNLNFELVKGFRLLTNNYWSDGGGRYIFGQIPDVIAHADGSLSAIHAASTVSGFEFTHKNSFLYAYYGGIYAGKNVAIDTTVKKPVPVGYGFTGSANGQNRAIQEITFGFNQTLWRDAKYGALNFMGQYSYLARNPWYIASAQPEDAHLHMIFFNLRYTLPGSAPAIK